ncbi:helix-turn-helix transcriptional regulator [Rhodobacter sp. 24-YEA-8]|uniref:helix-turn-helix transcriptional regulator n=1 Tax=Rhodobacter sp. 24-YEA-8 TaxID=1884310 RepID=UPI00089D5FF8|nr:helix-turn-helix domain-containing protein [Rhodobacter sp. 24-YEA-8]SED83393.1 DNA-binding transcriptional regulator, XRE-family HTH domain [Rhodobacter sp. 24-YEA-8]
MSGLMDPITSYVGKTGQGPVMPRRRTYSRVTREALLMLGRLIRIGRAERGLTAQDLADRAGISRTTLSNIEKGAPGPEIGTVFEVAALVGVALFGEGERGLKLQNAHLGEKLALLPKAVRRSVKEADDDF